ncbi:MAG: 4-hydroxythreonine-4-phosphate dehydrogenase PdxA [Planctomycetota bacterium]
MPRTPEPTAPHSDRPTIAVTLGDPGGIGPEITLRALANRRSRWPNARFIVLGSSAAVRAASEVTGLEPDWMRLPRGAELSSDDDHGVILVDSDLDLRDRGLEPVFERRATKLGGELSFRWVEDAIALAKLPQTHPLHAHGIVTAPISKHAWHLGGKTRFPGHTELFADRFKVKRYAMMFNGPRLRVSLATIHVPLNDVRNHLTIGAVHTAIDLGAQGCQRLGVERPRVAVCGLNPHAGEAGLLGDDEERLIEPAINLAVETGLDVRGPFPADTVFNRALEGEFDLVVAMYHDQGLIPVKLLARDESINVTVGLPTIRTSPDHGTAFDIAGKGKASAASMTEAVAGAVKMLTPTESTANAS